MEREPLVLDRGGLDQAHRFIRRGPRQADLLERRAVAEAALLELRVVLRHFEPVLAPRLGGGQRLVGHGRAVEVAPHPARDVPHPRCRRGAIAPAERLELDLAIACGVQRDLHDPRALVGPRHGLVEGQPGERQSPVAQHRRARGPDRFHVGGGGEDRHALEAVIAEERQIGDADARLEHGCAEQRRRQGTADQRVDRGVRLVGGRRVRRVVAAGRSSQ